MQITHLWTDSVKRSTKICNKNKKYCNDNYAPPDSVTCTAAWGRLNLNLGGLIQWLEGLKKDGGFLKKKELSSKLQHKLPEFVLFFPLEF